MNKIIHENGRTAQQAWLHSSLDRDLIRRRVRSRADHELPDEVELHADESKRNAAE